jgi:hypothetical protein
VEQHRIEPIGNTVQLRAGTRSERPKMPRTGRPLPWIPYPRGAGPAQLAKGKHTPVDNAPTAGGRDTPPPFWGSVETAASGPSGVRHGDRLDQHDSV